MKNNRIVLFIFSALVVIIGVSVYSYKVKDNMKNNLSIDMVKTLSAKGDALSWDDFEQYHSEDIGSGLYILRYEINNDFYLLIGGTKNSTPIYIYLISAADDNNFIDIRKESVDGFIRRVDEGTVRNR